MHKILLLILGCLLSPALFAEPIQLAENLERDARDRKQREHQRGLRARFNQLSPREREVLNHVLRGQLNKQIAADLGIDERSVKRHRTSLTRKLQVQSVAELAQLAVAAGFSGQ